MTRVAIVQMNSRANIEENLNQLPDFFAKAQKDQAKLLVLPENFAFMGFNEADKLAVAERDGDGKIQRFVSKLAKQFKLWVIAGTIPLQSDDPRRVKSSSLVYDSGGQRVARYDKIHLFDVRVSREEAHRESLTVSPGKEVVVVETPVGKIGLSVCYDLRFPELYRQLILKGAEIVSIPSAFTAVTGKAHWEILLRARAIENLCYVLAPNQGGVHENGRKTHGHSMIIEPWGKKLAE